DLVFVEESISATSPLVKAIERLKGIIVREPERQGAALEEWLIAQAAERGGTLTPDAATALASTSDLRSGEVESLRLIGEMEKLLTYANGQPVQAHDVRLLVPEAHVVEIFAFTDALSSRNRLLALRRLHDLRQRDAAFPYLLVMIGRQLRLLLRAQELDAAHIDIPQAASELKLPPGVVRGLLNQARRFHRDELVHALQRIVALDAAFKTGTLAEREDVALDLLVVELTGR
ncbi:MAG: hypothetical protein HYY04_17770, partial [Chloroflexi bacterium]|nr:hypothetical protein [Chloroflexota bacterium]